MESPRQKVAVIGGGLVSHTSKYYVQKILVTIQRLRTQPNYFWVGEKNSPMIGHWPRHHHQVDDQAQIGLWKVEPSFLRSGLWHLLHYFSGWCFRSLCPSQARIRSSSLRIQKRYLHYTLGQESIFCSFKSNITKQCWKKILWCPKVFRIC